MIRIIQPIKTHTETLLFVIFEVRLEEDGDAGGGEGGGGDTA